MTTKSKAKAVKAKAPAKPVKVETPKVEAAKVSKPGVGVTFDLGSKIKVIAKANPKKGDSAKRFAKYKSGLTVEATLARGLTRGDIRYDVAKGFIALA
jgi:hypothetical protein